MAPKQTVLCCDVLCCFIMDNGIESRCKVLYIVLLPSVGLPNTLHVRPPNPSHKLPPLRPPPHQP